MFAQVRISALNTALTAIYLAIVLPLFGVQLPLVKTMIAVCFIAGLTFWLGNATVLGLGIVYAPQAATACC